MAKDTKKHVIFQVMSNKMLKTQTGLMCKCFLSRPALAKNYFYWNIRIKEHRLVKEIQGLDATTLDIYK